MRVVIRLICARQPAGIDQPAKPTVPQSPLRFSSKPCSTARGVRRRFGAAGRRVCATPPGSNRTEAVDSEWAKEVVKEVVNSPELGKRGEAWFAAQLVALLLVAFPPNGLRPLVDAAGWVAVIGGVALIVAGQQFLGKNLTPLPKPRESGSLVTTGIYSYCRHPMYGGLLLASVGLSVALGDELRMVFAALVFLVLDRKASYEEQLLKEKYKGYEQYKRSTKKLIPYVY